MSDKEKIAQFIQENFIVGLDEELQDDDSLLEKGVIDSTGVLELVGYVERTYGFAVADDEVLPDNFDSINNLAAYVERKKAAMTPQPAQVSE